MTLAARVIFNALRAYAPAPFFTDVCISGKECEASACGGRYFAEVFSLSQPVLANWQIIVLSGSV